MKVYFDEETGKFRRKKIYEYEGLDVLASRMTIEDDGKIWHKRSGKTSPLDIDVFINICNSLIFCLEDIEWNAGFVTNGFPEEEGLPFCDNSERWITEKVRHGLSYGELLNCFKKIKETALKQFLYDEFGMKEE